MLDIKFIRDNKNLVEKSIKDRNMSVDLKKLLSLDEKRRSLQTQLDELRAQKNKGSKGKPTPEEIEAMKKLGEKTKEIETEEQEVLKELNDLHGRVPNLIHPETPIGKEEDYKVIYKNKEPQKFPFHTKDHEELLTNLNLLDFERGAKVVGSKFYFAKNELVRLNQALISYGLDVLEKYEFQIMETPDLAQNRILNGAGFNPRGDEKQIYNIEDDELSLIGTAEVTLLGYHADEVIDLSKGPKKYAALSHCFRREAGSYGRTSKGLYRVHQFTKLEMFVFCKPEDSEQLHTQLLEIEKEICDGLDFPYRVIDIPSGDLGAPAYRKFDIEAWMTMKEDTPEGGYGEITSTSNCTDYQARRLNIKYKNTEGKNEYVHTLNGTAVVLSRFPIAIAENFQTEDGKIKIPDVLKDYMGGKDFIG